MPASFKVIINVTTEDDDHIDAIRRAVADICREAHDKFEDRPYKYRVGSEERVFACCVGRGCDGWAEPGEIYCNRCRGA